MGVSVPKPAQKGAGRPRTPGSDGIAPAGWPREVRPPGAPGWERSAAEWLLDLCPADWRGYPGFASISWCWPGSR